MTKQLCQYGTWRRDRNAATGMRADVRCSHPAKWLVWSYANDRSLLSANYVLLCPAHTAAQVRLRGLDGSFVEPCPT